MCTRMSLQIECVIETFSTKSAQISFNIRVTFHMSIEKTLQVERFIANLTMELISIIFNYWCHGLLRHWLFFTNTSRNILNCQWILDAMSTIHKFQLNLWWKSQLFKIKITIRNYFHEIMK